MRSLILFLYVSGTFAAKSLAQVADTAGNNNRNREFIMDKCWATAHGKYAIVYGGITTVIGIAAYKYGEPKNPYEGPSSVARDGGLFAIAIGAPIFAAGCIMFGIGKAHDAHRRNYYSLVSSGNSLGVAYNF